MILATNVCIALSNQVCQLSSLLQHSCLPRRRFWKSPPLLSPWPRPTHSSPPPPGPLYLPSPLLRSCPLVFFPRDGLDPGRCLEFHYLSLDQVYRLQYTLYVYPEYTDTILCQKPETDFQMKFISYLNYLCDEVYLEITTWGTWHPWNISFFKTDQKKIFANPRGLIFK